MQRSFLLSVSAVAVVAGACTTEILVIDDDDGQGGNGGAQPSGAGSASTSKSATVSGTATSVTATSVTATSVTATSVTATSVTATSVTATSVAATSTASGCVPTPEICDGQDNDCDGVPDDGDPGGGAFCPTGQLGACADGTTICLGGMLQCAQDVQPSPEICGNAVDEDCDGDAPAAPTTYFNETFADNAQGWTLGPEWQIGPAAPSFCSNGGVTGDDPAVDHTATADNGVAGVIIGGCYSTQLHADRCITSPTIDLSSAAGTVLLSFWRHLHTDYPRFISSHADVSLNDGATWVPFYSVPQGQFVNDPAWTFQSIDVTAFKSATFRVRFCYSAESQGIFPGGGWSVDDVELTDALCN